MSLGANEISSDSSQKRCFKIEYLFCWSIPQKIINEKLSIYLAETLERNLLVYKNAEDKCR